MQYIHFRRRERPQGVFMKRSFIFGMLALALVFAAGLTSCASIDQQTLEKAGVPKDQRADLYLTLYDYRLEKIDGVKQGGFPSLYGLLGGWNGRLKEEPKGSEEKPLSGGGYPKYPVQVSAGEHTLVVSDKALIGRKSYEGTFNFEAGKKYVIHLVTPSLYESMQKPGFEGFFTDLGNHMKEALTGNQIIIIAESKKAVPTWHDKNIKGTDWKKSIK